MKVITRRRGQEMPDVGEGIGGHMRVLQDLNSHSTYGSIKSLRFAPVNRLAHHRGGSRGAPRPSQSDAEGHLASIQSSDPVSLTDTSVRVIRNDFPSTRPG